MDKLQSEEVIPDVLDKLPKHLLQVQFSDGDNKVNFGNKLSIKSVSNQPSNVSWPAECDKFYTLCLTDPDAPTRSAPSMKERCHWLITNIPSSRISEGTIIASFVPSCPPKESGLHRYTFCVFEQPSKLDFTSDMHLEIWDNRKQFNIRNFIKKYKMLEQPIAANFYFSEWDEDAQIIRHKLGLV